MDNLRHELQVQQFKWNLFWGINAHDSSKSEDKKKLRLLWLLNNNPRHRILTLSAGYEDHKHPVNRRVIEEFLCKFLYCLVLILLLVLELHVTEGEVVFHGSLRGRLYSLAVRAAGLE